MAEQRNPNTVARAQKLRPLASFSGTGWSYWSNSVRMDAAANTWSHHLLHDETQRSYQIRLAAHVDGGPAAPAPLAEDADAATVAAFNLATARVKNAESFEDEERQMDHTFANRLIKALDPPFGEQYPTRTFNRARAARPTDPYARTHEIWSTLTEKFDNNDPLAIDIMRNQ